jgi:hypothetical protein
MNKKLTLTIEQSVIDNAKKYAKERNRSLSDIVENYLRIIGQNEPSYEYETPITSALRGAFRTTQELDYKEDLIKGLTNKHLEVYGK